MNNNNKKVAPIIKTIFKKKENNMTITQEQFDAYVEVQESGITNMFNVQVVSDYSGLSRQDIMTIMSNYSVLQEKYGN